MAIFSLSRHSSPKMDPALRRKIQFLAIQRQEELDALGSVRRELDGLYQALETVTDEKLVDSVIYEIKSLEARYDYHFCNIKQMDSALRREAPQQIQDGKACLLYTSPASAESIAADETGAPPVSGGLAASLLQI